MIVTKYEAPPAEIVLALVISTLSIAEGSLVPFPLIHAGHSNFLRSDAQTKPPNPFAII